MENETKFSTKRVREIRKELVIGGGDLDLYLDAYIDGELVLSKKSDSLVTGFMNILYLQMGGTSFGTMPTLEAYSNAGAISSVSSGTGGVYRLNMVDLDPEAAINYVTLQGIQGTSTLVDGLYACTRYGYRQIELTGTTYTTGYTALTGTAKTFKPVTSPTTRPSFYSFSSSAIVIGTGDAAVALANFCLEKEIQSGTATGRLVYNTGTISQDTNDSTSSQITFTRTFTNSSGGSVTVNEVGMYASYGGAYTILITRDLIAGGIAVANGKTLTVNLRIKSTLATGTNPGGFLAAYTRSLYRMFANVSRAIYDVNNVSISIASTGGQFKTIAGGGLNSSPSVDCNTVEPGWKNGIVIGTGTAAVAQGDYFLNTPITHGSTTGKMQYYGGFVENFVADAAYVSFDIIKAIENNSGGSITVNEIGLVTGNGGNYNKDDATTLCLIARNTLTTGVVVANGEILKVVYTVKAIL